QQLELGGDRVALPLLLLGGDAGVEDGLGRLGRWDRGATWTHGHLPRSEARSYPPSSALLFGRRSEGGLGGAPLAVPVPRASQSPKSGSETCQPSGPSSTFSWASRAARAR